MKNALYIHRTQGGGVEGVHINGIADNLTNMGYKVAFLSPSDEHKPAIKENEPQQKKSFNLASWLSAKMPEFLFEVLELLYNIIAYQRGKKIHNQQKIDFIYERYAIFSVVGVWLAKKRKCPIILEVNYTSLSPLVRERSPSLKPLAKKIDKWIFSHVTAIVAVSSALKKELITEFNIDENKIEVIANAANPVLFEPKEKEQSKKACTIGFVGGFYPWHGLQLLVDAVVILKEKKASVDCLLIGDGPELPNIKRRITELGLEPYFSFPGRVPHAQVAKYVDQFDIGIMPDSNNYGSPMKLFEYMAAAIPFVAADYSPIAEITNGQGLLFEKQNASSFAGALLKYIRNDEYRSTSGKKGREQIENFYNWQNNTVRSIEHLNRCAK